MAKLKDSGARRDFGTGAVRDVADGKGRCDLLPLYVVAPLVTTHPDDRRVLTSIDDYIHTGEVDNLRQAIKCFSARQFDGKIETAMLEVSVQYEDGARKYADRNWEKGIPVHCFIDSGVRHYLKVLRGDTDEPHDRAFVWNMLGAIWTHEHHPELIDLPFAKKDEEAKPAPNSKYATGPWNLADQAKLESLCMKCWICDRCPLSSENNGGMTCSHFVKEYPEEARQILDRELRKD
ncbi:MAG: hypothetical protein EOM03_14230 [Clostridia bacterium]|nr:hypothetical protein [Clostridia bacterium]